MLHPLHGRAEIDNAEQCTNFVMQGSDPLLPRSIVFCWSDLSQALANFWSNMAGEKLVSKFPTPAITTEQRSMFVVSIVLNEGKQGLNF